MAIVTIGLNPAIDRILECPDFHLGGHQQARQLARLASGKAANVARALAHLGIDSIAAGFVGRAERALFHEQLRATPGAGRVMCHFVEVAGTTRENITILDPKRRAETHIRDRGFTVNAAEISQLEKQLRQDLKTGDVAIFSGSLCLGLPERYFSSAMDLCAGLGVNVVVDTNGDPLKEAVKKMTWVLKPNLEELQQVLGSEVPNAAAAIRDAAMPLLVHTEYLLVSRGRHGAVLLTREQGSFSAKSVLRQDAVRTVGCGDHLLAGFVAALAAGKDVERSLRSGMALATARALSPRLDEIDLDILGQATAGVEVDVI